MNLRDWFRRRPLNTDAIEAQQVADIARDRAVAQRVQIMRENDHIERRVMRNHFGEAIVHAWAERRA